MPEILLPTKAQVDALGIKVGTNVDAAGTSTLFARLAQIAGYTDQVEGYVDTIETLIGAANPVTGGTNSLFNYLKRLEDSGGMAVDISSCAPFLGTSSDKYVAQASVFETLLSINGKGLLNEFIICGTTIVPYCKITIDGTLKIYVRGGSGESSGYGGFSSSISGSSIMKVGYTGVGSIVPASTVYPNTTGTSGFVWLTHPLFFKTSVLIEIMSTSTTDSIKYRYTGGAA